MNAPAISESTDKMGRARNFTRPSIAVRLFLTCWLVYVFHSSPFVARELYLTLSLAEKHSVRVDEYVDLHSDLFFIPGRGGFMGGNPGVSILAAVPYWLSLPIVNRVAPVRPPNSGEKLPDTYEETRANRRAFYRKVHQRGLDMHLGLAAMITSAFFMAPLSAMSAVVMFWLFEHFSFSRKQALWLSLLYAFGTPIFFRATPLSPNLGVTAFSLFSFAVLCSPWGRRTGRPAGRLFTAGLLAGWSVVIDYSGVVTISVLGVFALADLMKEELFWPAVRKSLWFLAGAAGPLAFLLFYQWYCYGNPWLPVQYHQAKNKYAGYSSERGVGWPIPAALWSLLFDPLYGLLVFAPIFTLALYHPVLIWKRRNRVPASVARFCWLFFVVLWVFFSCIQYTLRHQWQEGVRYIVPAVPFLFVLLGDVIVKMPRILAYLAAFAAVFEIWCLSMVREDPLESILRVMLKGFELPWLTTIVKTAPQNMPWLNRGVSPLMLFIIVGLLVAAIWKLRDPWGAVDSATADT